MKRMEERMEERTPAGVELTHTALMTITATQTIRRAIPATAITTATPLSGKKRDVIQSCHRNDLQVNAEEQSAGSLAVNM